MPGRSEGPSECRRARAVSKAWDAGFWGFAGFEGLGSRVQVLGFGICVSQR